MCRNSFKSPCRDGAAGDACLGLDVASMPERSDVSMYMSMSNASALGLGGDDSGSVFMSALAWGSDLIAGDSSLAGLGACNECGAADIEAIRSVNEDPRMKFAT